MRETSYETTLTPRQREVLDFIKNTVAAAGFPPTRVEIAHHFGWKSTNAAEEHLCALVRHGAITITRSAARGITIVGRYPMPDWTLQSSPELLAWRRAFPNYRFDGREVRLEL